MKQTVLILSGPTHEYIDPVRFIGNASSGLMGKNLAEEAEQAGYHVEFITGPVASNNLPKLKAGRIHPVISAADMLQKASELFHQADVGIFAAAVADYTPADPHSEKIAKSKDDLVLRLKATADIAKTLGEQKCNNQITIGFALQTSNGETYARKKRAKKNLDGIVLNTPDSLGADTGYFSFLAKLNDQFEPWGLIPKEACAKKIIASIPELKKN